MNNKGIRVAGVVTAMIASQAGAQLPTSNVWLLTLDEALELDTAVSITNNGGYSNQPYFINNHHLYYTQSHDELGVEQTDIHLFDLVEQAHHRITRTSESEYSPTPLPCDTGLSVISVDANNKQWLQAHVADREAEQVTQVEPIGYHVWTSCDTAMAFVLGEPHTLQLVNQSGSAGLLADNVGPSLWQVPESESTYSYTTQIDDDRWLLMTIDLSQNEYKTVAALPDGAYYYAWHPQGFAVTTSGNTLWRLSEQGTWDAWIDTSPICDNKVTRVHFSPNGKHVAIVCE